MFDAFDRPSWDVWMMTLCLLVAQRSLDPSTKHGCVIVDDDKTILSIGYNSPPRGCNDAIIPLTRPAKYSFMAHSEDNAITNAARTGGAPLKNSTVYVTGHPCQDCFRKIINSGANEIIYGPIGSAMISKEQMDAINLMHTSSNNPIKLTSFDTAEIKDIFKLLDQTANYLDKKLNS